MATQPTTLPSSKARRYDPTRTVGLRNAWAREMSRRFTALVREVRGTVADRDYFGLEKNVFQSSTGFQDLYVPVPSESVRDFLSWFDNVANIALLGAGQESWTNLFVQTAYQRGILRGRQELIRIGVKIPKLNGMIDTLLTANSPSHLRKIGLLYVRVLNELKGITAVMSQQVGRALAQEIVTDTNAERLAHTLIAAIIGGSKSSTMCPSKRGELLARTETVRTHHVATIQEYRSWDIQKVRIVAEQIEGFPCRCKDLHGQEFGVDEAEGMIPVHPLCHCLALPVGAVD